MCSAILSSQSNLQLIVLTAQAKLQQGILNQKFNSLTPEFKKNKPFCKTELNKSVNGNIWPVIMVAMLAKISRKGPNYIFGMFSTFNIGSSIFGSNIKCDRCSRTGSSNSTESSRTSTSSKGFLAKSKHLNKYDMMEWLPVRFP